MKARALLRTAFAVGLALFVAATGVAGARAGATHAQHLVAVAPSPVSPVAAPAGLKGVGAEVPGLRTRNSYTFMGKQNSTVAVISSAPVNYRDSSGAWLPIDDSLVASGSGYTNKANAFSLQLPASLSAPVTVTSGGDSLSLSLEGAGGQASVNGAVARYAGALPGVDVAYTAEPEAVKETVTLASASAASSFVYALSPSSGLTPAVTVNGALVVTDAAGKLVFGIGRPFMRDAAGAVSGGLQYSLTQTGSSYTLTVTADAKWLDDPSRVYPVVIDPTIPVLSATRDCTIANAGSANSNFCSASSLDVGYDGAAISRSLLSFDTSGIPEGVQVLDAELDLYLGSSSTSTSTNVQLRHVTASWSGAVTWNSRDGSNNWTNPGADSDANYTSGDLDQVAAGATSGTTIKFDPRQLVQRWVDYPADNNGLLLKQDTESTNNVLHFNSSEAGSNAPLLVVTYEARLGQMREYSFFSQQLTDRLGMGVNLANGNVMLSQNQVRLAGTNGFDFGFDSWHNSEANRDWIAGRGWDDSLTVLVAHVFTDGAVDIVMPGGGDLLFKPTSGDNYTSPQGSDVTLTKDSGDGSYLLSYNQSAEKIHFHSWGGLDYLEDHNANKIQFNYDTPGIVSATDSKGRTTSFTYNGSGQLYQITDPVGRVGTFTYLSGSDLPETYTDPAGEITTFAYDDSPNGAVETITDPNGNKTEFTYELDGSNPVWLGRVTSIKRVTDTVTDTGPTWTFTYSSSDNDCPSGTYRVTYLTDPNNHRTTYCSDEQARIIKTIDALGRTVQTNYDPVTSGGCQSSGDAPSYVINSAGGRSDSCYSTDGRNNLVKSMGPANAGGQRQTDTLGYTDANHPYYATSNGDANGNSWTFSYTTSGDIASKAEGTSPGSNPVEFAYNPDGTPSSMTDAKGTQNSSCSGNSSSTPITVCFTYNTLRDLIGVTNPSPLGSESYDYDTIDRLADATDGKSQTTTYTYDGSSISHSMDRLHTVHYPSGATITYSYDEDGNLTSTQDGSATTSYTYDALNRLTEEQKPGGATIDYAYDDSGNLTSITENSQTTGYQYDQVNRLTGITEPSAGTQTCPTSGITATICLRYPSETESIITYPGGAIVDSTYDTSGRLTSIADKNSAGAAVASYSYSYAYTDSSSNPQDGSLRRSVTSGGATTYYCYDSVGRLLSAASTSDCSANTLDYKYSYDKNGNLTSKTVGGVSTSLPVNDANELASSGYSYDANGNQTAAPSSASYTALGYNERDQTDRITPSGGSAETASYFGRGQTDRTGFNSQGFLNDLLGTGRRTTSTTTTDYTRTPAGSVYSENVGGSHYYFAFDGLGSIVGLFNSNGTYLQDGGSNYTAVYEPYGKLTNPPSASYPAFDYRYAGYWYDTSTGLYKTGARYYDPNTSRWTQRDPIDNPLELTGWNRYSYAGDDPINGIDPSGACIICSNPLGIVSTAKHAWHFVKKHENAISCGFFVAGVALGVSEIYVGTREAIAVGRAVRAGVRYSGHIARLGAVGTASGLSFVANIATGGCSAVGGL